MPYSSSDYDTAVSAFNVLPESMAVENLIRLRQGNELGGLQINKARREEQADLDDEAGFQGFSQHLSGLEGKDPEEIAAANRDYVVANPGALRNKDIMESLRGFSTTDEEFSRSKARGLANRRIDSQDKDEDWLDAHREEREEAAALESKTHLEKAKFGLQAHKNLMTDASIAAPQRFGQSIGLARNLPQDVSEGLVKLGDTIGYDQQSEPYTKAISDIVAAHGANVDIESSYKPELKEYGRYIQAAQDSKINLDMVADDPSLLPAAKASMLEMRRKELVAAGRKDVPKDLEAESVKIDKAIELNSKIYHARKESTSMEEMLRRLPQELGDLPMRARKGDIEAQVELSGKMAVLGLRAFRNKGAVEKGLIDQSQERGRQLESLKVNKEFEGLKSIIAARANADGRLDLAEAALEVRKKGLNLKAFDSWMRSAKNTKIFEKVKDTEEYRKIMDQLESGKVSASDNVFETTAPE